jgi:DNA-binding GntR family transcriptional regulator
MSTKSGGSSGRSVPSKMTGSRKVYEILRRKILSLELQPGSPLDENTLVKLLKVSRTPVREALIRLSAEDLVVVSPNRGAHVAPIDLGRMREFHEALDLCQRAVTHWAALRRTPQDLDDIRVQMIAFEKCASQHDADGMIEANRNFHSAIGRAGRNAYLRDTYERMLVQGLRVARIAFDYNSAIDPDRSLDHHLRRVMDEHALMLKFVADGDAVGAEKVASSHAKLGFDRLTHTLTAHLPTTVSISVYPDHDGSPSRREISRRRSAEVYEAEKKA